jgi:hypothetical protein
VSRQEAVTQLFVAFGAQRNVEQAQLYLVELEMKVMCSDCIESTCAHLMRTSKRLPTLVQLLEEGEVQLASDRHGHHISMPQLGGKTETDYRTDAVKVILPAVGGDKDVASFIAAEMWWSHIELDDVANEIQTFPIWVTAARTFLEGKDPKAMAAAAFRRARWAAERDVFDEIPEAMLALEAVS